MNKLSETLAYLREQKGVYLKEVAPVLGVSIGTVSNYEHGVHSPDPDTLLQLADYYNVSLDYLVGRTDCPYPISILNQEICENYTVTRFLDLINQLPENELANLVHTLKAFELRTADSGNRS